MTAKGWTKLQVLGPPENTKQFTTEHSAFRPDGLNNLPGKRTARSAPGTKFWDENTLQINAGEIQQANKRT